MDPITNTSNVGDAGAATALDFPDPGDGDL
jgi:hypothetical protein